MLERKRALKSNTRSLQIKNLGYEKVSKFEELMKRTGAETEEEAFVMIIDILDSELPKIEVDYRKMGKIPQHVIEWRKANGYDEIAHLAEDLCRSQHLCLAN